MFFNLQQLELRNCQSYGNNITKVNLNFNKPVLIIGRNLDSIVEGQIDSNGAGKTTLLNALSFTLYNRTFAGHSIDELMNFINKKNFETDVNFEKNGKYYRVERFLDNKAKGGSGVYLLCKDSMEEEWNYTAKLNGGHDITKDSINNTYKFLEEEILEIPFEIFSRIIAIVASFKPFLDLKLDEQRTIVEELFGFTEISKKAEVLKNQIKQNKIEFDTLNKLNEQIKNEIERYTTQLQYAKSKENEWTANQNNEILKLETDINVYSNIDYVEEEDKLINIDKLILEIWNLNEQTKNLLAEVKNKESTLSSIKEWNNTHSTEISKLEEQLKELPSIDFENEQNILNNIQNYTNDINTKLIELKLISTEVKNKESTLSSIKEWDNTHSTEISKLEEQIGQYPTIDKDNELSQLNVLSQLNLIKIEQINNLKETEAKIISYNNEITSLLLSVEKLQKDIAHLSDSKCPYCLQNYDEAKVKLTNTQNELTVLNNDLDAIKFSSKSFSTIKDGIVVYIDEINNKIEDISKKLLFKSVDELNKFNTQISKLTNNLDTLKAQDNPFTKDTDEKSLTKEIKGLINKTILLTEEISNIQLSKEKLEETTLFKSVDELNKFNTQISKLTNNLDTLKAQDNPFTKDTDEKSLIKNVEALTAKINEKSKEAVNKEMMKLLITLKFKDIKELSISKTNLDNLKGNYNKLKADINPHTDNVASLENSPPSKLKDDEIQKLYELLEHQEFLLKLLTKKDSFIRKALVNRYIPYLNTRIKYYLEKIGLPHNVQFQQNMTVKITQFKSELSFKSLSAGQKARVNLALSFAFRDVLQSRYGGINFCMLDECLDIGLGTVGVQLATKMIKSIAKEHGLSMYVISHREELLSSFSDKMVIELKNGFSSIVESDV